MGFYCKVHFFLMWSNNSIFFASKSVFFPFPIVLKDNVPNFCIVRIELTSNIISNVHFIALVYISSLH